MNHLLSKELDSSLINSHKASFSWIGKETCRVMNKFGLKELKPRKNKECAFYVDRRAGIKNANGHPYTHFCWHVLTCSAISVDRRGVMPLMDNVTFDAWEL